MTQEFFDNSILELAADYAHTTMDLGHGGPFGAAIVKDGKIITVDSNSVLKDNDPTAHAEVNAIRHACKLLGTYDLTGCELYTTSQPCPMCMSAIIWANIKLVHNSALYEDAEKIGFRDQFILDYLKSDTKDSNIVKMKYHDRSIGRSLFSDYASDNKVIY